MSSPPLQTAAKSNRCGADAPGTWRSRVTEPQLRALAQSLYDTTVSMQDSEQLLALLDRAHFVGEVRWTGPRFENAEQFVQTAQRVQANFPDVVNKILPGRLVPIGEDLVRLEAPHRAWIYRVNGRTGRREPWLVFHSKIRFTYAPPPGGVTSPARLQRYEFLPGLGGVLPTLGLAVRTFWRWLLRR